MSLFRTAAVMVFWVCLQQLPACACRYNVRDVGFVDLDAELYHLYIFHGRSTPAQWVAEVRALSSSVLRDGNIAVDVINADDEKAHPSLKFLPAEAVRSLPAAALVSPDGPVLPVALFKDETLASDSLAAALRDLVSSPTREAVLQAVSDNFAAILLIEGENPDANDKVRQAIAGAQEEISAQMNLMPKAIAKPPALVVLEATALAREKILLWSLGLGTATTPLPRAAILYGRARWIGPLMKGDEITTRNLAGLLSIIGADCECGLDISWTLGTRLPVSWNEARQSHIAKALGFDPENPMVKLEISRIVGRRGSAPAGGMGYQEIPLDSAATPQKEAATTGKGPPDGAASQPGDDVPAEPALATKTGVLTIASLVVAGVAFAALATGLFILLRSKKGRKSLFVFGLVAGLGLLSRAEDWPAYQHDSRRSGCSSENLAAEHLTQAWVHRSPQPPRPAWDGPAKWDAYANLRGLKSMRNYDPVFHVAVEGKSLYFGGSVDDSVRCLDTRTGKERWFFATDGAVRIAPAIVQERVYFGSDDGHAYCLDARNGELVWKFAPIPSGRLVLHDGHFISFWPCRTGVLVDNGTAYFGLGMLPWKESYLCAVDALTGKPEGPGRFVKKLGSVTLEGAILASKQRLISPQGRVPPLVFDRKTGDPLGPLPGGGGCFVLLTEDSQILYGPGNKTGWIQESSEEDRAKLATFQGGHAIVVEGNRAYLLTETALIALDRATRQEHWRQPWNGPCALIKAGPDLYVGGIDRISAFRAGDGQLLWQTAVSGKTHGLAAADGALFASTDDGVIYCFRAGPSRTPTVTAAEPRPDPAPSQAELPELQLASGPCLQFIGRDRARVWWRTAQPMPTHLEWGCEGEQPRSIRDTVPKTDHTATLEGLRENRVHEYAIQGVVDGKTISTAKFECDTAFNYNSRPLPEAPHPFDQDAARSNATQAAEEILAKSGVRQGVCLVLGCGQGQLAYALAKQSQLQVIGVETDLEQVKRGRQALLQAGAYGNRVLIHHVASLARLPFPALFANLVVHEFPEGAAEQQLAVASVAESLRPYGGVALVGGPSNSRRQLSESGLQTWLAQLKDRPGFTTQVQGSWAKIQRGALRGAGVWSHEYGTAANAAYAGETLEGARGADDLEVQWLGRPGPRVQADRNGRKPSPLATNGRLFMQGLQRVIALDAFNGTILWTREIPPLQRFNMPRDCSNWCADDDSIYAAIGHECWRLDAGSGEIRQFYSVVPGTHSGWQYDWGYLSIQGSELIGSANKKGSAYVDFWGGSDAGWYDATYGPVTDKVCSENLFALNRDSGEILWLYAAAGIINSTITIEGDRLFFLESRHPQVKASPSHRIGMPELWEDLHLVALDRHSGRLIWQRAVHPAPGQVVVYLACGDGKLVLVSSGNKKLHVYTFEAEGGQIGWQSEFPWPSDNHGRHMARPAIVNQNLYVRPKAFHLATGRVLLQVVPDGGCGTYAASSHALFFRSGNVTVWDLQTAQSTSWERLRPDCWLSTFPAGGLLLSPEAGGGCSCGSWMETSIAFAPRKNSHLR
ncbi:MAG: PQQ-binding-like beta-propeller repeat protein [Verrucomicrobiia bacterium]